MSFHSDETAGSIHILNNYEYADETARLAATGFTSEDVGKVAKQTDNSSYWVLTTTTPTWMSVTGGGVDEAPIDGERYARKDAGWEEVDTGSDISCKITKSASQSIPNATLTAITWNQESYDTDGMHDTVTNNTRVTFNTAGKYSVLAQAEWENAGGLFRFLEIMKNGSGGIARVRYTAEGVSENIVPYVGEFQVSDYIELCVYQDAGGNIDFESGTGIENTYLEAHKIN